MKTSVPVLRKVKIGTPDLDEGVKFYVEKYNFSILNKTDERAILNQNAVLFEIVKGSLKNHHKVYEIEFVVADVKETLATLEKVSGEVKDGNTLVVPEIGISFKFTTQKVKPIDKQSNKDFEYIDHMTFCIENQHKDKMIEFLSTLGCKVTRKVYGEKIKMMDFSLGKLSFVLVFKGEVVQKFIKKNDGPGVQHMALHTKDILKAVRSSRKRGLKMGTIDELYYSSDLPDRSYYEQIPKLKELEDLNILIDGEIREDEFNYILQIFVDPSPDSFFIEFIHRQRFPGFGENNIKALVRSQERASEKIMVRD